ncbi:hypothetical protein HMPREF2533_04774 [Bacteroides fragilis]|nr:hypothetical protein HMPREF2533_04774 [Bacteroides fragilis]KXU39900.1 hypothetical protein HMPREF2530_04774 [Bacteroides fragilis]
MLYIKSLFYCMLFVPINLNGTKLRLFSYPECHADRKRVNPIIKYFQSRIYQQNEANKMTYLMAYLLFR